MGGERRDEGIEREEGREGGGVDEAAPRTADGGEQSRVQF